jgi:2-C-methyl-D-erythritol 4-phosphate cytidylyltransferase
VPQIGQIAVVVSPGDEFLASESASLLIASKGGSTRAASVFNGLIFLLECGAAPDDWVLVHDAARCLITPEQIKALIDACADDAVGGLLAHKLPDTLKSEVDGRVAATLDRSDKWLAQTPQMFRIGALIVALQEAGDGVTDESSAMEAMGLSPKLVPGSAQNFKVTYPEDFALAEAVLLARQKGQTV